MGTAGCRSMLPPMLARDFSGLPPAYVEVEEFDCLHDEGTAYAKALEAAGVEPELRFDREDMTVWASPEALDRVYRNLIANALRHGGGGLAVSSWRT